MFLCLSARVFVCACAQILIWRVALSGDTTLVSTLINAIPPPTPPQASATTADVHDPSQTRNRNVATLAFNRDASNPLLASAGSDCVVRLWQEAVVSEAAAAQWECVRILERDPIGHYGHINSAHPGTGSDRALRAYQLCQV